MGKGKRESSIQDMKDTNEVDWVSYKRTELQNNNAKKIIGRRKFDMQQCCPVPLHIQNIEILNNRIDKWIIISFLS